MEYLSPYKLPRHRDDPPDQVADLLNDGHVTVIRLPLDGGRAGSAEDAAESVREQLEALDETAMVFLPDLAVLCVSMDGKRVERTRSVESDVPFPSSLVQRDRVTVSRAGPAGATQRFFQVWSRTFGGADHPDQKKRIKAAVRDFPRRWHELQEVKVAVAVEETRTAPPGLFFISLPTETDTTVGAHINAPFYGSLDRRYIYFEHEYNELLLEFVTDLMRDAVEGIAAGDPEDDWRGPALIDLLAPVPGSPGAKKGPSLTATLRELQFANKRPLDHQALILCDGGWRVPEVARTMPNIPADDPLDGAAWRAQAGFDVVSSALDERREAVETLLRALGGSPDPKAGEWVDTLVNMAKWVKDSQAEPAWDDFLRSTLAVLPRELTSEPAKPEADPLRAARFLPTSDGRLCAVDDDVRVFFRPRQDDAAAGFADSIPNSLTKRIAFLHSDVKTLAVDGKRMLNTPVQKFLDGRFMRSFRREDILRAVVDLLPELPVEHGTAQAAACAEALAWTLEVVGEETPEGLLPLLARLPVACTSGWFAMREALFGPGWPGRSGDQLKTLADGLPGKEGDELMGCALLRPGDERWFLQRDNGGAAADHRIEVDLADRADQFERAGVADGLRLVACDAPSFWMRKADPKLPDTPPAGIPQAAWDDWKGTVLGRGEIEAEWKTWFEHKLEGVLALPVLHRERLGDSARAALSNLILASLAHWEDGWEKVTVRRKWWSQQVPSPLKHWLSTLPWLVDTPSDDQGLLQDPRPLHRRWFVPGSLLQGQVGRFRHLSPLSLQLARRLGEDEELLAVLQGLGLNVYPTYDDTTGPALLEALADVAETVADGVGATRHHVMPAGGFDVLLGQIRHAWRHLDPDGDLPTRFIVRTRPRTLTVRSPDELTDVYLPDQGWQTRLLRQHSQPIVAIRPEDVRGSVRDRLIELGARPASQLEERCTIDSGRSSNAAAGAQKLAATELGWLPVVLLALHAHGGGNPAGPATKAWREAAATLRRARVSQCLTIAVELRDGERSVAHSEPRAHWLSREGVLVIQRDVVQKGAFEQAARACQAILNRQDLLKDLRLVLGALGGSPQPTRTQIEAALDRAEIDAVAAADIRLRLEGETRTLVHRIRPVLKLLDVSDDGLEAAETDTAGLTAWLAKNAGGTRWPTEELLAAARDSYDDADMGYRAWRALDDAARLPKWNEAMVALGDGYEECRNEQAEAQAMRHLDAAAPLLRAFARYIATRHPDVALKDQGALFERIVYVHERIKKNAEWPRHVAGWVGSYWQVPFEAVLMVLRAGYDGIPKAREHLDVIEPVRNTHGLRSALEGLRVDLAPDPHEVARGNRDRLDQLVRSVRDIHAAWRIKTKAKSTSSAKGPALFDASMYLRDWTDEDLLQHATLAVTDEDFRKRVAKCATIDEMLDTLGLAREDVGEVKRERDAQAAEKKRKDEAFIVAGEPFEIGGPVSYRDLFTRLRKLPDPKQVEGIGPPPPRPDVGGTARTGASSGESEAFRRGAKTGHLHGPPNLPELVGIVGEMHAFRFLEAEFGDSVKTSAWVSESRTKVEPLLDGEEDLTSDSLGYDFRFTHDHMTWCVEVKATTGDGTGFGLPPSELNAAARIAPRRNERWRILRVTKALSERPECYWLPNPFEPGPGELLRLRPEGGSTVEYSLPESAKGDRQQPTRKGEDI